MISLSENSRIILKQRYLERDPQGRVCETPEEMFARVARHVAAAGRLYSKGKDPAEIEQDFFEVMTDLDFLPNSPALMNAGTRLGQLAACFVLPVPDSIRGIFKAVSEMAVIHQSGGGTGFSFSRLRPEGGVVKSTGGVASGPVSFMRVFDQATEVVKQGGRRRGANMGILRVDHPDIRTFVQAKEDPEAFTNFNISVAVTDRFMKAVKSGKSIPLINPKTGRIEREENAPDLFGLIARMAWKTGDPGLLFVDEVNRKNPTPDLGEMDGTNPCGELPLYPYESCNLGSINLSHMVQNGRVDYRKLKRIIGIGVRFLDNIIDLNRYPFFRIKRMTLANRKIGLGVMGWADMLIRLGIPYDSEIALRLAGRLMRYVTSEARKVSAQLARERGPFPNFSRSIYPGRGFPPLRNATVTTVAPTGTISIIAGTSSGIEPHFAVSFVRHVLDGRDLIEFNPLFEEMAAKVLTPRLRDEIMGIGSIRNVRSVPKGIRALFKTAMDIAPEDHLKIQAAFQRYTDNAVSKTVNLPEQATADDVKKIYLMAHALKCKGVTIYRYGSKGTQVLNLLKQKPGSLVSVDQEFNGYCRVCGI
ncbi:MAG: ribonucleoside-diphosphate reductase, adenosylcobalamin-dependent [Nitrospirae bacterium CG2_30_53_67]|nr:MAG: ribonucleoside-diphosphate reductase, adenosylcobalamin-dependent [Nitrospirae bacterium CG2_30_53_67]